MHTKLFTCVLTLAAALAVVPARAQNLTATLTGIDPGLTVEGTFNDGQFIQAYPVGLMRFTEFDAFCAEPGQDLAYGETLVFQIQSPATLGVNSDRVARLVGAYLASGMTNRDAAAVQWAIWETVAELSESKSLANGNMRITGAGAQDQDIVLRANEFLANAASFDPVALTYLSNDGRQDVVTWNAVPEPATSGLSALAGSLLLIRRRR